MDFLRRLAPARETDAARAVAVLPSRFASESPLRATIGQDGPAQRAGDDEARFELRATIGQAWPAQQARDDEATFAFDASSAPAATKALAAQRKPVAGVQPSQTRMRPPESGPTHPDFGKAAAWTPAQAEAPQIDAAKPRAFEYRHGANSERAPPASPKLQSPVTTLAVSQGHESAAAPPAAPRVTLPLSQSILAQRALQSRDDNQVVHVTIGRIDVVANAAPAPGVHRTPPPRQATVTLADYLRGSKGSRA